MNKTTILTLFGVLFFAQPAYSQSFKETMIEFKKFEAKTKSGVNLSRYIESISSIEYATDAYRSEADELNNENKAKFQLALEKYKHAANAWRIYNAGKIHGAPETFIQYNDKYCPNTKYIISGGYDNFDQCISEIWNEASNIISSTRELRTQDQSPPNSILKK